MAALSKLFVMGKYVDSNSRSQDSLRNDFYSYHIATNTWHLIADHAASYGGPQ